MSKAKHKKKAKKIIIPRKPAESKKSINLSMRLTAAQSAALRANAAAEKKTVTDLIVDRCCR